MPRPTKNSRVDSTLIPVEKYPGSLGNAPVSPAVNIDKLRSNSKVNGTLFLANFPTGAIP
jgi:hypothetical protein